MPMKDEALEQARKLLDEMPLLVGRYSLAAAILRAKAEEAEYIAIHCVPREAWSESTAHIAALRAAADALEGR